MIIICISLYCKVKHVFVVNALYFSFRKVVVYFPSLYDDLFSDMTLYPSSRSSSCIYFLYILINSKTKKNPCQTWVKQQKLCHKFQVHFPWEREGSLTVESPSLFAKVWCGLAVHIRFLILNLQAKFFKNYVLYFGRISSELYKFCAVHPKSCK